MLASRPREILRALITSPHPVKVQELANQFRVSPRTVKYDLDSIRDFLNSRGIELFSRPNIGLWVSGTQDSREKLTELFVEDIHFESVLSPQERISYIAAWLLLGEGFVTFAELADELLVSRNTVIADVKHVELFLQKWNVCLDRQARLGIRAQADEMMRRRAAEHIVLNLLNGTDMFQLIQCVLKIGEGSQLNLTKLSGLFVLSEWVIESIMQSVGELVQASKANGIFLADRDIIGVFVRLCVLTCRSQNAFPQTAVFETDMMSTVQRMPIFQIIKEKLGILSKRLDTEFSDAAVTYVSLYFVSGTSLTSPASVVTRRLIENVTKRMNVPFDSNSDLFDNLLAHISSSLEKFHHGVPEPNPLTSDITRNYPALFTHVKLACVDVLAPEGIDFADSDAAYLVLHFAAAYERIVGGVRYSALVVCSTGRGSARFLKSFFENEVRRLQVVACCSVSEVTSVIQSVNVDLVITALPLDIPANVPVVRVGHLPTKDDVASVHNILPQLRSHQQTLHPQRPESRETAVSRPMGNMQSLLSKDVLQSLELMNQGIITRGFELSHLITAHFQDYLTEESVLGLTLHILLMVNRLAFNDPYQYGSSFSGIHDGTTTGLRDGLKELMRERHIDIPEAEVDAILRYFSESYTGGGEK